MWQKLWIGSLAQISSWTPFLSVAASFPPSPNLHVQVGEVSWTDSKFHLRSLRKQMSSSLISWEMSKCPPPLSNPSTTRVSKQSELRVCVLTWAPTNNSGKLRGLSMCRGTEPPAFIIFQMPRGLELNFLLHEQLAMGQLGLTAQSRKEERIWKQYSQNAKMELQRDMKRYY